MPTMGTSTANTVPSRNIQITGVKKLLLCQNPHKASGPDQIIPRFLKEMASSIAPALDTHISRSYEQGQIPDDWKRAFVTPLFKKRDKSKSCCCKVTEHTCIVHNHLMKFLENNKILSYFSHSFGKRRPCETQLITTIHDLAFELDRQQ